LINDLHDLVTPIYLVLDDYQFISNPTIHEGIAFLLDHLPANLHLMIATRSDPPLPLARLRGRNLLLELRSEDFRFTAYEAAHFLNQVMHSLFRLGNFHSRKSDRS
jgi:LuxR family maltose regulon positive regulatory protein